MQSNFLQHHKNELWDDAIPENLGDFQRPKVNRPFTHLEAQDELKWVFLSFGCAQQCRILLEQFSR